MEWIREHIKRMVVVDPVTGCWVWQGGHANGYARFSHGGIKDQAHRVSHMAFIGPIPANFEIDHVKERGCTHLDCVNPDHLEAVTHAENMRRIGQDRTHCKHGHPYIIRANGKKVCNVCNREAQQRFQDRRRNRL